MKQKTTIFTCFLIILSLVSCSAPPKSEGIKVTGVYFDTVVQVEAWGASASVLEECRNICEAYEQKLSKEIADSEISRINAAGGHPAEVSPETAGLIETALEYCELSGGAFDITIAAVSELWDFTGEHAGVVPDAAAIGEACRHVDYHTVTVEGNTVTLADPQARIDLGGIAKGYIADRLKEYLVREQVSHALINLGGNVLAVGGRYDGTPFCIGIQKPFAGQNETITSVEITDQSVVSSGNYERYFEENGAIYHHILNPKTGYPYQNQLSQVTIISESSVEGDALSTVCYALGLEKGRALIETLDKVNAIFITDENQLYRSPAKNT